MPSVVTGPDLPEAALLGAVCLVGGVACLVRAVRRVRMRHRAWRVKV